MSLDPALLRKHQIECAWSIINSNCVASESKRFISGLVVSSDQKNSNGDAFLASGLVIDGAQIPLLIEHDAMRPLGKVIILSARGVCVRFVAELLNSARLAYADQVWGAIVLQDVNKVSIGPRNSWAPYGDRIIRSWSLEEISVVGDGADSGAIIERCSERLPYVSLNGPNETVHWRTAPC